MNAVVRGGRVASAATRGHVHASYRTQATTTTRPSSTTRRHGRLLTLRPSRGTASSLALARLRPSGPPWRGEPPRSGHPRLGWLDRLIVPAGSPIAPSRWHQHIVQRRLSRLDHLRPHRLNWEAEAPRERGGAGRRRPDARAGWRASGGPGWTASSRPSARTFTSASSSSTPLPTGRARASSACWRPSRTSSARCRSSPGARAADAAATESLWSRGRSAASPGSPCWPWRSCRGSPARRARRSG